MPETETHTGIFRVERTISVNPLTAPETILPFARMPISRLLPVTAFHWTTVLASLLAGLVILPSPDAQAQAPPEAVPIEITAEDVQEKQALVQSPDGFTFHLFATAPEVNYPAAITATPEGDLFVAVDKNASLDQELGRGQILKVTDADDDGQADYYTAFVDSVDSPRGLVYDGQTLYVMHPPTLTAYEDTDGDGVADRSQELVTGLGFDLDFRGADHTTNGMQMGIDGWLYITVGDYGFFEAEGTDGRRITYPGGAIVRVRPDGSELEIYATGLRNVYDIALDPFLNGFERGNTNDGYGWRVRLQHIVPQAEYGYPSRFRYFPDEVMPPMADYGGGSGTGALYVDAPHLPDSLDDALYTVDWGRGAVFHHRLQPAGASFTPTQQSFLQLPVPTDMTIDGRSNLYASSWMGASFRYSGEDVGFIVRLTHEDAAPEAVPDFAAASTDRLLDLLAAPHSLYRQHAQRELLRRGPDADVTDALTRQVQAGDAPLEARVAALFTLKQLDGPASHPVLMELLDDSNLRAFALRALADRTTELDDVAPDPFVAALTDDDPRVRLQAANGLARLDARAAADALMPLAADPDRAVAHVAIRSLIALDAVEPALKAVRHGSSGLAQGALQVLQQIHAPESVSGLITLWEEADDPFVREQALAGLARLTHREVSWDGESWWGTTPNPRGPYYDPVTWSETERIRPILQAALTDAENFRYRERAYTLERHRAVPDGADALLLAAIHAPDSIRTATIDALVGHAVVTEAMVPDLAALADQSPRLLPPLAQLLVAQSDLPSASTPLLRRAALDNTLAPALRAQTVEALVATAGDEDPAPVTDVLVQLIADDMLSDPLAAALRDYIRDDDRSAHAAHFAALTRSHTAARQQLGYAVLLALAGHDDLEAETQTIVEDAIASGWDEPSRTARLLWAIGFTEDDAHTEAVRHHLDSEHAAIRDAARYAAEQLGLEQE